MLDPARPREVLRELAVRRRARAAVRRRPRACGRRWSRRRSRGRRPSAVAHSPSDGAVRSASPQNAAAVSASASRCGDGGAAVAPAGLDAARRWRERRRRRRGRSRRGRQRGVSRLASSPRARAATGGTRARAGRRWRPASDLEERPAATHLLERERRVAACRGRGPSAAGPPCRRANTSTRRSVERDQCWRRGEQEERAPRVRHRAAHPIARSSPSTLAGRRAPRAVPRRADRRGSRSATSPSGWTRAPVMQEGAMRIGMLTGGGDCPGLNAVIRAVVRKGEAVLRPPASSASATAGAASSRARSIELTVASTRGVCCTAAARSSARRARTRTRHDGDVAAVLATLERERIDALIAIGGEDTLGVAREARRRRRARASACPKTIDNDLVGHRLHVRVRHRGADRDRRDRPAAHDGREPRPRDGRRGDGPARRVDRAALRARRRRRRRSSCPRSRSTSTRCARGSSTATSAARASRSSSSPRARRRRRARWRCRRASVDEFGHVRLGGIGNRLAPEIEERTGFETRVTIARPRAARRHADRVRPHARDPLRARGDRRGARAATSA